MKVRIAVVLISLLLAPLAHALDAFVVPSANEAVEGDSNNAIPFSIAGGDTRYQQVYLGSDMPPGPFPIYGIAFRPNGAGSVQPSFAFEIPNVDIFLASTDQNTNLTPDFDINVGFGYTLVASGPLPLASAASGPGGGPLAFDIEIWFDQPFAYTGGNLLLDVFVQPYTSSGSPLFDAVNFDADPVGRMYSAAGVGGGSVGATTGAADTQGLVTKFMLVPEPTGSAAAALAALAALMQVRRQRSRSAVR